MNTERIATIQIDASGRLCVKPESSTFEHIFRSAMEVNWDSGGRFLYSPSPREWPYDKWFRQIVDADRDEYGYTLLLTNKTRWVNVDSEIRKKILELFPTSA